ncbi:MAG TPA: YcxB family protein [Chitinophagaceae bacterium]|nr:YcxB family protein [Chitinophagaceae bacterium]
MEYHFRYSLTTDDFAEYSAYTSWYAPWQKKVRIKFIVNVALISLVFMPAGIIVSRYIRNAKHHNNEGLGIIVLVALIFLLLFAYYQEPFRIKNKVRKFLDKDENSNILTERNLEINDKEIVFTDDTERSFRKWDSITRNAVTKEYFYLYTNSVQGYIIPKRLFSSQREIDEFDKFLTEKIPLASSFRSMGI